MGPPGLAGPPGESGREVSSLYPLACAHAGPVVLCLTSSPEWTFTFPPSLSRELLVLKAPLEEMVLLDPR